MLFFMDSTGRSADRNASTYLTSSTCGICLVVKDFFINIMVGGGVFLWKNRMLGEQVAMDDTFASMSVLWIEH